MPVQRWRHLVNDTVRASDADTYALDLPENGALHALMVRCAMTNGATGGRAVSILDVVDEIRVVGNGNDVYYSHHPRYIEKDVESQWGHGMDLMIDEQASAVQHGTFPLLFGRWMFDPAYYLPVDKIKAPRLEIVYSPLIQADGGFATGTFTVNVLGLWSPSNAGLRYNGTLVNRAIKNFTSVASGDDPTDIDLNDPIRQIGIYAYEVATEDGEDISRVVLQANAGEFNLVEGDWRDLQQQNQYKFWGDVRHDFRYFAQDNDTLATRLAYIRGIALTRSNADDVAADTFNLASFDARTGDRLTFNASQADVTAGAETHVTWATDALYYVSVWGDNFSYFNKLDWSDVDERAGYLDPSEFSKLKLVLTQAGAGADVRIGVQSLRDVTRV